MFSKADAGLAAFTDTHSPGLAHVHRAESSFNPGVKSSSDAGIVQLSCFLQQYRSVLESLHAEIALGNVRQHGVLCHQL